MLQLGQYGVKKRYISFPLLTLLLVKLIPESLQAINNLYWDLKSRVLGKACTPKHMDSDGGGGRDQAKSQVLTWDLNLKQLFTRETCPGRSSIKSLSEARLPLEAVWVHTGRRGWLIWNVSLPGPGNARQACAMSGILRTQDRVQGEACDSLFPRFPCHSERRESLKGFFPIAPLFFPRGNFTLLREKGEKTIRSGDMNPWKGNPPVTSRYPQTKTCPDFIQINLGIQKGFSKPGQPLGVLQDDAFILQKHLRQRKVKGQRGTGTKAVSRVPGAGRPGFEAAWLPIKHWTLSVLTCLICKMGGMITEPSSH